MKAEYGIGLMINIYMENHQLGMEIFDPLRNISFMQSM